MDFKAILLKELETNKALFHSAPTPLKRLDAYQKGSILTEQIAKLSPEGDRMSVYSAFFKDCNLNKVNKDESFNKFIEARNQRLGRMINNVTPRKVAGLLQTEQFLKPRTTSLEPRCATKYRSCQKSDVHNEELKVFQRILGECPSPRLIELPPQKPTRLRASGEAGNQNPSNYSQQTNSFINANKVPDYKNSKTPNFRTAKEILVIQNAKKGIDDQQHPSGSRTLFNYGALRKTLGARRGVRSCFLPPARSDSNQGKGYKHVSESSSSVLMTDERLANIDPKMIQLITNEIMHKNKPINWADIAGLDYAKATIKEAVVWPLLRPDIFTGLRRPPRGILLFGPPGTGKTLIGKCIASQSKSTFFSISASSLTSKWVGDGEKMVRALFAVAAVHQPSVVFIDEIDSLLCQRSESEHESSRRLKTEFLVQLDGANTREDERILIVGATNRPQELDEAARRRLVRRLYIPLPVLEARIQILTNLLQTVRNSIASSEICEIGTLTNGYSGADMETLCREASMEPIRSIPPDEIPFFNEKNVRPVIFGDFRSALKRVRPTVSQIDLEQYANWNKTYGSGQ